LTRWIFTEVSTFLSCEKDTHSTTELVAGGIGVTVAIFILACGTIWVCSRKRPRKAAAAARKQNTRPQNKTVDTEQQEDDMEYESGDEEQELDEEYSIGDRKMPNGEMPPRDEKSSLRNETYQSGKQGRQARVEDVPEDIPQHENRSKQSRTYEKIEHHRPSQPDYSRQLVGRDQESSPSTRRKNTGTAGEDNSITSTGRTKPLNIRKSSASTLYPSYYRKASDSEAEPVPPLPPYSSRPSPETARRSLLPSSQHQERRRASGSGSEAGSSGRTVERDGSRQPRRPSGARI